LGHRYGCIVASNQVIQIMLVPSGSRRTHKTMMMLIATGIIGYIKPGSSKLQNPEFLSGIIRIQMKQLLQLTLGEQLACEQVKNQTSTEQQVQEGNKAAGPSFVDRMKERTKKRKAGMLESIKASLYMNVDFICGSVAEVERLWSIAKHILSNSRLQMTPHLFETLIYLKINHEY